MTDDRSIQQNRFSLIANFWTYPVSLLFNLMAGQINQRHDKLQLFRKLRWISCPAT